MGLKSEILNIIVGYYIDYDPSPMLFMQPTLEMAEALFKGPVIKENEFNKAVVKLLATELKRCGLIFY